MWIWKTDSKESKKQIRRNRQKKQLTSYVEDQLFFYVHSANAYEIISVRHPMLRSSKRCIILNLEFSHMLSQSKGGLSHIIRTLGNLTAVFGKLERGISQNFS